MVISPTDISTVISALSPPALALVQQEHLEGLYMAHVGEVGGVAAFWLVVWGVLCCEMRAFSITGPLCLCGGGVLAIICVVLVVFGMDQAIFPALNLVQTRHFIPLNRAPWAAGANHNGT